MSSIENKKQAHVILVGPTNVGKSSLFNKLIGWRQAIVCDRTGVTVDRHEEHVEWDDKKLTLVDTGGIGETLRGHELKKYIEQKARESIELADVVVIVLDGCVEPSSDHYQMMKTIRKRFNGKNNQIILALNKSDRSDFDETMFFGLGVEKVKSISCDHKLGIEGLRDEIVNALPEQDHSADEDIDAEGDVEERLDNVMIIGKPNSGKSTLLNVFLGYDRFVTSPISGTTRDPTSETLKRGAINWTLIDSPGLRRPGRLDRGVEWVAKVKLIEKLKRTQLAILLIDGGEGFTDLDNSIATLALDDCRANLICVVNKKDLYRDEEYKEAKIKRTLELKFIKSYPWVPVLEISALEKRGIRPLLEKVKAMIPERHKRVSTGELNRFFKSKLQDHSHPLKKGHRRARFNYMTQVGVNPPHFIIYGNMDNKEVHYSFKRFVQNSLRSEYGFESTPLIIDFKSKKVKLSELNA